MNPGHPDKPGPAAVRLLVADPERIVTGAVLAGLSMRQLAARAGWSSHSYLLRVTSGTVRTVTADAGVRIAEALGIGMDDLFVPVASRIAGHGDHGSAGVAA